jgi:hypothetical protein
VLPGSGDANVHRKEQLVPQHPGRALDCDNQGLGSWRAGCADRIKVLGRGRG